MTRRAVFRRGLIEENCLGSNRASQLVAFCATHSLMRAPQGERRPLLMVKQRRLPLHAVVTFCAPRHVSRRELLAVDIFMAVLALRRRRFEIHIDQLPSQIGWFVTIDAGRRPVRPQQRKLRLGVIESRDFLPRFRCMTSLATYGGSVGPYLQHPFFELALVRICVATGAVQVFPVIDHSFWLERLRFLVALTARNRQVSASQHEMRFLMLRQREC